MPDILTVISPISLVALVLALYKYLTERKEKQKLQQKTKQVNAALLNLDQVAEIVRSLSESVDYETPGFLSEADASLDVEVVTNYLLRASFDLHTKKVTLRLAIERVETFAFGKQHVLLMISDEKLASLLRTHDSDISIHTRTEVLGFRPHDSNSPSFREFHDLRKDLDTIRTRFLDFRDTYERLEPDIFDFLELEWSRITELMLKYIRPVRDFELDLSGFKNTEEIDRHLLGSWLGFLELREEVARAQSQLVTYIKDMQKELFKVTLQR